MKILKIVVWHTHACCFFCVLFSAARLSVIHNKDLLATIHLLVAMVKCFQPELDLPPNVKVEVAVVDVSFSFFYSEPVLNAPCGIAPQSWFTLIFIQVSRSGIKSHVQTEVLTEEQ